MKDKKVLTAFIHSAFFAIGLYVGFFAIGVAW